MGVGARSCIEEREKGEEVVGGWLYMPLTFYHMNTFRFFPNEHLQHLRGKWASTVYQAKQHLIYLRRGMRRKCEKCEKCE